MKQELFQLLNVNGLSAVEQLLTYIQQTAIDSENTPIAASEVPIVAHCVVQRLVLQHPHLAQVIQEVLDDFRFNL